jgi:hypothetical protein
MLNARLIETSSRPTNSDEIESKGEATMPTPSALSTSPINADHPKGLKAVQLFRDQYNKAGLDDDGAQYLNENPEFPVALTEVIRRHSIANQFASEEVASTYGYPAEYKGPKPIAEQITFIAKLLLLSPDRALEFVKTTFPTLSLPEGIEGIGWGAFPTVDAVAERHFRKVTDPAERYCRAVILILEAIGTSRTFTNYRKGQILADRYRMHERTAGKLRIIASAQPGDIQIFPFQFGIRHRGRSMRRACEVFIALEFGLGAFHGGSQLLVHPERLVRWEQLHMDLPGDEFAPSAVGAFSGAPYLLFHGGGVGFDAGHVSAPGRVCGSVSAFLPQ